VADLREAQQGEDPAAIQSAMDALTQASHKLAEAMYASAGAEAGTQPEGEAAAGEGAAEGEETADGEGAVDADFTVVDEDEGKPSS
jgi:molecular chaperone DnaK